MADMSLQGDWVAAEVIWQYAKSQSSISRKAPKLTSLAKPGEVNTIYAIRSIEPEHSRITTYLQVAGDEKEPKDDEANHRPNLISDVYIRSTNDLPPVPTE
jgi:hypothetical protein